MGGPGVVDVSKRCGRRAGARAGEDKGLAASTMTGS
jgi:hypothetical protein